MTKFDSLFTKIINREIKANIRYEDDFIVAFDDINPVAPVHVLIVPKKPYINIMDFITKGSTEEVGQYFKSIKHVIDILDLEDGSFRMITNNGESAGQTIMYFHIHIIGGKILRELV